MVLESSTWKWLAKALRHYNPEWDLQAQRVENTAGGGTPDVEGFIRRRDEAFGVQFQLELKAEDRPVRKATPLRFDLRNREKQIEFMKRRWEMGGNAHFLLQVGSGHERTLYLVPGTWGERLRSPIQEGELLLASSSDGVGFGFFNRQSAAMDVFAAIHRSEGRRRNAFARTNTVR